MNSHASRARRSERRVSTVPPPGRCYYEWALKELNLPSPPHLFCDNGFTDRREEQSPVLAEWRGAKRRETSLADPCPSTLTSHPEIGTGEIRTLNLLVLNQTPLPIGLRCRFLERPERGSNSPRSARQAGPTTRWAPGLFLIDPWENRTPASRLRTWHPPARRMGLISVTDDAGGSRTHTGPGLNRLPLPLGYHAALVQSQVVRVQSGIASRRWTLNSTDSTPDRI